MHRLFLIALVGAVCCHGLYGVASGQERPPSPVNVVKAVRATFGETVEVVGTIVPSKIAIIGSATDGRVSSFPVESGYRVKKMQPVAQLLTETIGFELKAALAELKLRQQELLEMRNGARKEELDQAKAALDAALSQKQYFGKHRERLQSLANQNSAVAEDEYEKAVSSSLEADQIYLQRKAEYELARLGPRQEDIEQASARVEMQKAIADRLESQIKKHTVISRMDGYVTDEFTEIGEWVKKGDPIVEISALDEVDIEIYVVEKQIPFVEINSVVSVSIPSLGEKKFKGNVRAIVPKADLKTRTFPVRVRIPNEIKDGVPLIKAGMLGRVSLPLKNVGNSLLVPKDAVVLGGVKPAVFFVTGNAAGSDLGEVISEPVELGMSRGSWIVIRAKIPDGALIVVRGNERLRPGQKVRFTVDDELPKTVPKPGPG